jgi:hypothetical protein
VAINAKNGHLPAHNDDLTVSWPAGDNNGKLRVATRSILGGGRSSWQIAVEPDTAIGDYSLHVELVTASVLLIADLSMKVIVPRGD